MRELRFVDVEVESYLPEDPIGDGFDVVGDAQVVSPLLIEAYLEATGCNPRRGVRGAVAGPCAVR